MKLKVTYTDGETVEVNAGPRSEVALERQYGVSLIEALDPDGGKARVEHIYYLGWAALHFAGQEPKDFDDFLGRLGDVTPVEDKEPGRPTQRAARSTASPA